jgi:PAS domain S-box-containing protein
MTKRDGRELLGDDVPGRHGDRVGGLLGDDVRDDASSVEATHDGETPLPRISRVSDVVPNRDGSLTAPSPERILTTVLELSRTRFVEQQDDEIAHGYVNALRQLLPGRRFCVRLVAPDTGELRGVYATGRLRHETRESIVLSREARTRHELALPLPGVTAGDAYVPLFEAKAAGFDVPVLDGARFFGVVAVEYAPGSAPPARDTASVVPIVLQLAATLRNAQLFRESTYLRDYLAKLLESANAPIVVFAADRSVSVVNRAFLALTGYARESLVGHDFLGQLPDTERRRLVAVHAAALRGESTSNLELSIPRATSGFVRLSVNVASIASTDGTVEGVIAVGRDLTEVRELEHQIIQAEKLATLGQLAAGVVHELNNPLTSITVYAEHLLRKNQRAGGDPTDSERLGRILEAAQRILNFTRDLVTYARPSAEEPREVSLDALLEQSVVFCEHVLGERGVTVERRYAPGLPAVLAVPSQLHQVFINLITNACHAMPEGAGRLVLETARERESGPITVRVTDNGSGIPAEIRDRIFEPFYTTKSEGKGTGLGLSIVRNIVHQHRGEIAVESAPGEGTSFVLTLFGKS